VLGRARQLRSVITGQWAGPDARFGFFRHLHELRAGPQALAEYRFDCSQRAPEFES
jgi:hypothetical protein